MSEPTAMDQDPLTLIHNEAEDVPEAATEDLATPQPAWLSTVAAALPVLMCFLGTGRSPWAYGLAAAVIGLLALVFPPRGRVPFALLGIAGTIILFTVLPMLPLPWPHWPAWRSVLMDDYQLVLPSTWSLQPLITLENWAGMVVMGLWFFWVIGRTWPSEQRTVAIRLLAAGFIALAVTALVCRSLGWKPPGWNPSLTELGPFANRNHFSTLMAITALLCLAAAYELQRRKSRWWIVYALGVVPAFAVTLLNTSRGGLVLFFVGTMLWFLTSSIGGGGGSNRKAGRVAGPLAIAISLMFVLIAGLVLFGQPLLKRFSSPSGASLTTPVDAMHVAETLASDSRLSVYSAAVPLAADQPMLGLGLGNFGAVFALVHQLPNAYTRFRHPESDWLWFLCEAGWPATFAMLLAVCLIISWMEPWKASSHKKGRRERRLRRTAGLAFLLAIGHGVVDTPNHDLPQLLLVILLAALALRPSRLARARGVSIPWLFRAGGAGALLASGLWFATNAGMATPFGLSRSERDIRLAETLLQEGQDLRAYNHASLALATAPAHWKPYFLRAQAALKLGRPESEAMADFGRARHLEPHSRDLCLAEAATWLSYAPLNALPAWREALNRDPLEASNSFRIMLSAAIPHPELRAALRDLATKPALLAIYLDTAPTPVEALGTLQLILQRYPSLEGMGSYERQVVVNRWQSVGDRQKLIAFLEAHPALGPDTWRTKVQLLADEGKLEAAFKLLQQYVRSPASTYSDLSANLAQLDRDFQLYPSDAKRGLYLYAAQRDKGLLDDALATLNKVAALPTRPRHVYFEMANIYAQKSDYPKAWQMAQQYLNTPE